MTNGMRLYVLAVLTLLAAICVHSVNSEKQYVCENLSKHFPVNNNSLAFVLSPPGDQVYACPGGYVSLPCCMAGYTSIQWQEWIQPPRDRPGWWHPLIIKGVDDRYLEERNQTFVINRVEGGRDETSFRCTGYDVWGHTITNTITLTVEDCSVNMPLTFFGPRDVNTTLPVRLNDPVSMQCFVFSGSNSSESCTEKDCLTWYMRRHYKNGTMGMPSEIPDDGRFEALTNRDERTNVVSSLLHINNTQMEDSDWLYVCDTFQEDMKDKRRYFRLNIDEPSPVTLMHWIIVTVLGTLCLVAVVVSVLYKFNVEIQVCYKTRIKKRPRLEDRNYHVFLLHTNESREDRSFSLNVIRPFLLEKLQYRVFSENDINFGENFLDRYAEGVENSCVLVVVVSKDLLEDEACKMCIRDAINLGRHIIYIVREAPGEDAESIRDILIALRTGTKITWPRDDDDEVDVTAFHFLCSAVEPRNQMCREIQSPAYCKNRLQLNLLKSLEDRGRRGQSCVCLKTDANNIERHPIVDMAC